MAGCGITTPEATKRLVTTETEWVYEPFTDWTPVIGLDTVKAVLKRKSTSIQGSGNMKFKVVAQYAKVRADNPEPWETPSGVSEYSDDGDSCTGEITLGTSAENAFFVRFGVGYKLDGMPTPPTLGQSDVALQVSYNACGRMVGGRTLQLQADSDKDRFHPVTGWVPAISVNKVKAAIIMTADSGGTIQCRLTYRTADAITEETGGWDTSLDSWHKPSSGSNWEGNTGEIPGTGFSIDSKMWIQFGIRYALEMSSTTFSYATVSTAVAVRSQ